ncbi:hypothetical protein C8R42DRAFT_648317 [Lentinula raphanica]|nr:hypothetical protein C8R42DRAFT_648317 [Lentinula raphanica]
MRLDIIHLFLCSCSFLACAVFAAPANHVHFYVKIRTSEFESGKRVPVPPDVEARIAERINLRATVLQLGFELTDVKQQLTVVGGDVWLDKKKSDIELEFYWGTKLNELFLYESLPKGLVVGKDEEDP